MDAQVGKVMDALKKAGLEEKTIVIFTSDHGYHLGEHDFWAKVSLRDESAGVPLIISVPHQNAAGEVCASPVELVDVYPTLVAACGLEARVKVDGLSLMPLLTDPSTSVRQVAISQYPRGGRNTGNSTEPPIRIAPQSLFGTARKSA